MVSCSSKIEQAVGDRSRSTRNSKGSDASFKGSNALLKGLLGGVGQSAVDVTRFREIEPSFGMGAVVKNKTGGLIDRNCSCSGCNVRLFLSCMEGDCFEMMGSHRCLLV